jgi:hypothetical protein
MAHRRWTRDVRTKRRTKLSNPAMNVLHAHPSYASSDVNKHDPLPSAPWPREWSIINPIYNLAPHAMHARISCHYKLSQRPNHNNMRTSVSVCTTRRTARSTTIIIYAPSWHPLCG